MGLIVRMRKLNLLTEFRYRTLIIEASKLGYRSGEPESSAPDTSLILDKVFNPRHRGLSVSVREVADDLKMYPEDIYALLEGLVWFPVPSYF